VSFDNWIKDAVCHSDDKRHFWTSSVFEEIEYAKAACADCPVKVPCIVSSIDDLDFAGVVSGMSILDRLMFRWKKVNNVKESNWFGTDSLIEKVVIGEQ
jgi:hypothetical protein